VLGFVVRARSNQSSLHAKKNAGDFHHPALSVNGVELFLAASAHGAEEDSGQAEEDG
jgi:hypothetical protein